MINELAQVRQSAKQSCESAGDDTVGGEPVAVFRERVAVDGSTSENQLWVSKKTGLPLRSEAILNAGQSIEQTFSYVGVQVPQGAS